MRSVPKSVRTINQKKVVPGGFEPPSPAIFTTRVPKARRIDHYPTGLGLKSQRNYLFFMEADHGGTETLR